MVNKLFLKILRKFRLVLMTILNKVRYLKYNFIFGAVGRNTYLTGKIWYSNPKNIFIGSHCRIGPYSRIETFSNYGEIRTNPILKIEDNTNIEHAVHIYCANSITISEGCLIASGCMITDNNHGIDPESDYYVYQPLNIRSTMLGKGVWLGENVCVLAGSIIGERSIIGSSSVVKGVIPPFCIASGNPARVRKIYNFEKKEWEKVAHSEIIND
jgi:acetyltransferase-like isoleucine patch superfamily enzyme